VGPFERGDWAGAQPKGRGVMRNVLHEWMIRLRFLLRGKRTDGLEEEMREHIERLTEMYLERGMEPREARRLAMIDFGGVKSTLATLPAEILAPSALQCLRAMNPEQAIVPLKPVQGLIDRATAPRRFFTALVGIFAALGLILASLGIYGVISYAVTQETQEIGIRMTLGATPERVRTEVIARTLKIAAVGIAIGTAASLVVARAIRSMLFGTAAGDPIPFVAMVLLLLGVALLAGYLPARRASRIDPMVAMRSN
jgi:FtsX-like permease family